MQIHCRSCRAKIAVEDVNLDRLLAKCRACQSIFDISDQVPKAEGGGGPRVDKASISIPASLRVNDEGGAVLSITRLWGRGIGYFFLIFSLIWIITIAAVGALGGFRSGPGPQPFSGFLWLFMSPFVLVGAGTFYVALALLANRTTLRVEDGRIRVRHSPIPWPGHRDLPTEDLVQLYCTQYVSHSSNNIPQYRFAVWGLWRDGRKAKVVSGIQDLEQAYFIENAVEKHLRIEDAPVEGEYLG